MTTGLTTGDYRYSYIFCIIFYAYKNIINCCNHYSMIKLISIMSSAKYHTMTLI